jgi:hypothetical protein
VHMDLVQAALDKLMAKRGVPSSVLRVSALNFFRRRKPEAVTLNFELRSFFNKRMPCIDSIWHKLNPRRVATYTPNTRVHVVSTRDANFEIPR